MINRIPVFLSCDNKYAAFVATTMASILMNTKSFIDFYVLEDNITDENKKKILSISTRFRNCSIDFLSIFTDKYFDTFKICGHISKAAYSRFLIPTLKPELSKVIYTDVDVAFMDDIKKLYDINLNGSIIAAVPMYRKNKDVYISTAKKLGLSNNNIFCSGLLIIDCVKWNENDLTAKLMDLTKKLHDENKITTADQDAFNCFFDDNYYHLQIKWCIYPSMLLKEYTKEEIIDLTQDKGIIHYAGGRKPWHHRKDEFANYFWKYVPYTDFLFQIVSMNKDPINTRELHYKQKYINAIIKLLVGREEYNKLKKNPIGFFNDSKSSFIRFLGKYYFGLS